MATYCCNCGCGGVTPPWLDPVAAGGVNPPSVRWRVAAGGVDPRAGVPALLLGIVDTPGPLSTDRSRKMMSIAPRDEPRSLFWSQNRPDNIWDMISTNLPKAKVFGSAFLAGAFVSWEIHDLNSSYGVPVSVPSRGFCFVENTWPRIKLGCSGQRS